MLGQYFLDKRDKLQFHFRTAKLNWIAYITTCIAFSSARFSAFSTSNSAVIRFEAFVSGNEMLQLRASLLIYIGEIYCC